MKFKNGIIHIKSSLNNTIFTVTNLNGNTIIWSSSGNFGFIGLIKNTIYANQIMSYDIFKKIYENNIKKIGILTKGTGIGRDIILQFIHINYIFIKFVCDITPILHNGCKYPKIKRI
uniref:ribosomal protein S11 n=1 Tax=Pogoniopsis schenckii TaxID=1582014 RepID=UPI0022389295|nr:ribosomal protein S11 [Pogoniopsis schenckii]UYP51006.1 ribosomal protein S11 [Pogoniopsis schenckii]